MSDPADDDKPMSIQQYVAYLRSRPPRPGFPRKTLEEIAAEQGVTGLIDWEMWDREGPGPLYEGFEEDIRRTRRGLPPKGPQK
jgi:hypothetical protein